VPVRDKELEPACGLRLDFIVAEAVIVEAKAVAALEPIHEAHVLTYLKLTGVRIRLLINFIVPLIEAGIKRLVQ